jgi:hypothetical protein
MERGYRFLRLGNCPQARGTPPLSPKSKFATEPYSPQSRKWITVPEDFIAELCQADFPAELVERHCPQCYEDIYARLNPQ